MKKILLLLPLLLLLCLWSCNIWNPWSKALSSEDSLKISQKYLKNRVYNVSFKRKEGTLGDLGLNIDSSQAANMHNEFMKTLVMSPETAPGSGNHLVSWNKNLKGWAIPVSQIKRIITQPYATCDTIRIYIGIQPKTNHPTLIFLGSAFNGKWSSLIFGKSNHVLRNTAGSAANDEIYEYVDPCLPTCAQNSF